MGLYYIHLMKLIEDSIETIYSLKSCTTFQNCWRRIGRRNYLGNTNNCFHIHTSMLFNPSHPSPLGEQMVNRWIGEGLENIFLCIGNIQFAFAKNNFAFTNLFFAKAKLIYVKAKFNHFTTLFGFLLMKSFQLEYALAVTGLSIWR